MLLVTTNISLHRTTTKIKSKYIEKPSEDIQAMDNGSTRFHSGTSVFKVFEKIEHRGEVKGYDPVNKLYHIVL